MIARFPTKAGLNEITSSRVYAMLRPVLRAIFCKPPDADAADLARFTATLLNGLTVQAAGGETGVLLKRVAGGHHDTSPPVIGHVNDDSDKGEQLFDPRR